MIDRVDLRINNVDIIELSRLSLEMDRLMGSRFEDRVIREQRGANEFVLTIKPGSLYQIKRALRVILGVVAPERVAIET